MKIAVHVEGEAPEYREFNVLGVLLAGGPRVLLILRNKQVILHAQSATRALFIAAGINGQVCRN